jgi:hypothetical protein
MHIGKSVAKIRFLMEVCSFDIEKLTELGLQMQYAHESSRKSAHLIDNTPRRTTFIHVAQREIL